MKDEHKKWYNPLLPFHAVKGTGTGGVTILIRKNLVVWLYRMIRFGEFQRHLCDSRGVLLIFNKIDHDVIPILEHKQKIHAHYNYTRVGEPLDEWDADKYNSAFDGSLYWHSGSISYSHYQLALDPYQCWAYGYKAHFVLEKPFGKRKHFAYWRPIDEDSN